MNKWIFVLLILVFASPVAAAAKCAKLAPIGRFDPITGIDDRNWIDEDDIADLCRARVGGREMIVALAPVKRRETAAGALPSVIEALRDMERDIREYARPEESLEALNWLQGAVEFWGGVFQLHKKTIEQVDAYYRTIDIPAALAHFRESAKRGDHVAEACIGLMHAVGLGVEKDEARAYAWLRKAAEGGVPEAQYQVGRALYFGRGVAKDAVAALPWTRKAATAGHRGAALQMAAHYESGGGVDKDAAKALRWRKQSACQGHPIAQRSMGSAFESGAGVPRDLAKAARWYALAAKNGEAFSWMAYCKIARQGESIDVVGMETMCSE